MRLALLSGAPLNFEHGRGGVDEWTLSMAQLTTSHSLHIYSYHPKADMTHGYVPFSTAPAGVDFNAWLKSQTRGNPPDLWLVTNFHDVMRLKQLLPQSRVLLVLHGNPEAELSHWVSGWRWWWQRWQLRQKLGAAMAMADGLVTVSHWMANYIRGFPGGERVVVIPYAIPQKIAQQDIMSKPNPNEVAIINGLGSPNRIQDFKLFLATWRLVQQQFPAAKAVMVGGMDSSSSLQLAKSWASDVAASLEFYGFSLNPWQRLSQSSIFLHTSCLDTFSIVTLEAMTLAKACVATRTGGIPEVLADTGRLCAAEPRALAQAVVELLQNPQQVQSLGDMARKRALQNFTLTQFQQRWLDYLARF